MEGKKSRVRPKKQQIKVDDKISKLKNSGSTLYAVMESISRISKTQVGGGIFTQIPYIGASASAGQQQKRANQSPIPMQVNLIDCVAPPPSRGVTVTLGKKLEAGNQAPKLADAALGKKKD